MCIYRGPVRPWEDIGVSGTMVSACGRSLALVAFALFFLRSVFAEALTKRQREDSNLRVTEDAVIIEVYRHDRYRRSPDGGRLGLPGKGGRPTLPNPPCFTTTGQPGRCTSFRSCYPYYKASEQPFNWGVLGSPDTCSYFGDQLGQTDVFQTFGVCCTSPVISSAAEARPALGTWPPPLPPLPTHPPDHTPATHPPHFGVPGGVTTSKKPTYTTTKKPTSTSKKPFTTTTWGTKPTTTAFPWPPTHAPITISTTTTSAVVASDEQAHSCGAKNGFQDQERIVGGHNADQNEWPWIAALFNGGRQFCGGSLIDSEHILTAAHCVAQMTSWDVARLTVRLGDHDIRSNTEVRHIERRVKRVVRHRGFDMRTLYNDVSVITMDSPVSFSSAVRPICLPYGGKQYSGLTGTVIGWGSLRESGPQPSILQEVSLPIWKNSECRDKYGAAAPGGIVEHMLCAGRATKDSCSGDSGGPLMVAEGGKWTQVGVVSWGIGCGKGQYPGVYSRVSFFLPWIQKNSK